MKLKDIISRIVFEHLKFNDGIVNAEALIDTLTIALELDKRIIKQLIYRIVNKLTSSEAQKVADAIVAYKHLLYKNEKNLE